MAQSRREAAQGTERASSAGHPSLPGHAHGFGPQQLFANSTNDDA